MSPSRLLDGIVDRVIGVSDRVPVVVFDLDSTIIDTGPRHASILRAFAAARGDADLMRLVAQIPASEFVWTVDGPLRARGIEDSDLFRELGGFWKERFFSAASAAADTSAPGAVSFVRAVHDAGAVVVYLTSRVAGEMGEQTVRTLSRAGFPVFEGRSVLQLKPSASMSDADHKRGGLARIDELGGVVVATFENDPAHCHTFHDRWPAATHVLVGASRPPNGPEPRAELARLASFDGSDAG